MAIPSRDQPPRDTDPDCNITQNETRHVYLNCTYVCQVDEAFYLSGNESCYLGNSSNQGICVNGTCIPLPEQTTEGTTDIEISIETTAPPKPPGCDDNTSGHHTHQSCTVKCGDELVALNQSQPCYLSNASSETGICFEGTCVPVKGEENATEMEIPSETTAVPRPPGCGDNTSSDHTHEDCTVQCGDEMVVLNGSQPCFLRTTTPPVPVSVPTAMERSESEAAVGVCQEGSCVPPHNDYAVPEPVN
uniref:Putative gamma-aminobutyric acid gaba-a receptor subunit epsilon n=1 Tax=Amblyomma tuberculatum TaxID=48802 RepID=A0A6M2E5S2_9ACAR